MKAFHCGAVAFNASKRELFTTNRGYKSLQRRLRVQWTVRSVDNELTLENLEGVRLWISVGPREKFTASELEVLEEYLDGGGNVMVLLGEGGETKYETNINFLLEKRGITVNDDAVACSVFFGYPHPKEALVLDGVSGEIRRAAGKVVTGASDEPPGNDPRALAFLYPYGATLNVMEPAAAVLSTGSFCLPSNRPVLACREGKASGKLAVLGSCHMFSDGYIGKEENGKIADVVLRWLLTGWNWSDAGAPVISEYTTIPDVPALSERPQLCLQHAEEPSRDFTSLFDMPLLDLSPFLSFPAVPCREPDVKHEPHDPTEAPLPPPPAVGDLAPPVSERFDCDDDDDDDDECSSGGKGSARVSSDSTASDSEF